MLNSPLLSWERARRIEQIRDFFHSNRPDALVVYNDGLGLEVLAALFNAGVKVPDECAVVCCDNTELVELGQPPLSAVHIPHDTVSEAAVRHLELLLGVCRTASVQTLVKPFFVARQSCGTAGLSLEDQVDWVTVATPELTPRNDK